MSVPCPSFTIDRHPGPLPSGERSALLASPGFGRAFTDHMATVCWSEAKGWHDARLTAHAPLTLYPAASVFHNGQMIFEGLKAYRLADGGAALFRADANAMRFQQSARRLAMPEVPRGLFVSSIQKLVKIDSDWIPEADVGSLYLRPFMVSTEPFLGVRTASEYLFVVIASPVGAYFKAGAASVTLWVSEKYTRSAPGGTGDVKCGGNYAPSLTPQREAVEQGCDQVVFLDAVERRWVEELGGMNVFFLFDDGSIQTPPLGGTILPGITRDSLLTIARDCGLVVREEPYAIEQWEEDARSGRLREAFSCGTAAVVTPIGRVRGSNRDFEVGNGGEGSVTATLRKKLIAIQRGEAPDPREWCQRIF